MTENPTADLHTYYLYNTRLNGWLAKSSLVTSQMADAALWTWHEAEARIKSHRQPDGTFGLIPVDKRDIDALDQH